jgi:NADH-quinone oxidoreductase subunit L
MRYLAENAYLVFAAPLLLAVVGVIVGRWAKAAAPIVALGGPLLAILTGVAGIATGGRTGVSVNWIEAGERAILVGWRLDALASAMLIVVGVVASAVIVFSIGYMHGDRGYSRYFALLSLFTAAMALLVVSDSLVALFVGWELVGACSFLLIGFWYDKPAAAEAARKAFLVTRVGDVGFLLGIAVLWVATGTVSITGILGEVGTMPAATVTLAALLLFAGAAGKSAQFPLHVWLPDAMEGPTPVSALIHAATMVAAGVFLIARMWPLFEASAVALQVILVLGTITALGAATVAVTQSDIKKVLAYSTISQLGFMFAALGVGAWGAAMFHLITHAAFKSLLFLCAGSVIHGSGTQEMGEMGGLRRTMPITAACWFAGALALAGMPPLSGFFSKDAVLASVLHASPVAGGALVLASLLTGVYVGRTTQLVFLGTYRGSAKVHESGPAMTVPLAVLAVAAVGLGAAQVPFEHLMGLEPETLVVAVAVTSVVAGLAGLVLGVRVWSRDPAAPSAPGGAVVRAWSVVRGAYGYDALLRAAVVAPAMSVAQAAYSVVDRAVVDAAAEGTGGLARAAGGYLARLQTGDGQLYAALVAIGVLFLFALAAAVGS